MAETVVKIFEMNLLVYFDCITPASWLALARELGSYLEQHFKKVDSAQSQITLLEIASAFVESSAPNCYQQATITVSIAYHQIDSCLLFR